MVQGVEVLLGRHKALRSDPSTLAQLGLVLFESNHSTGVRDWCILVTHWPASLPERMNFMFSNSEGEGLIGRQVTLSSPVLTQVHRT